MGSFSFEKKNYVIENYDVQKPFSSFLPGISGVEGIPMWTFYVNRGQCVSSFGVQDKDSPMMEFAPASVAYKDVYTRGFRTFIKNKSGGVEELFSPRQSDKRMRLTMGTLEITDTTDHLMCTVSYCNVPGSDFAGLLRKVSFKNMTSEAVSFECLDGIPEILPYGIRNEDYKENGHLLRSWMDVLNLENGIPFYKLRASTEDETEVIQFESGHFTMSWNDQGDLLPVLVDMENIFAYDTSLQEAELFKRESIEKLLSKENITANKLPGYFTGARYTLEPSETCTIYSLFGHTADVKTVNAWAGSIDLIDFARVSFKESISIVETITDDIQTKSGEPVFDQYCRQSYLDNVMRGGYPITLGDKRENIFYVFSRKHGDQERDYNFFSISPEYYSQGNGNFRDVNQNRRNDVFFHPEVGKHNIKLFFDLIQLDGYNPLVIEGQLFRLDQGKRQKVIADLEKFDFNDKAIEVILSVVEKEFSPGALYRALKESASFSPRKKAFLDQDLKNIFNMIFDNTCASYKARHSEGFWTDHWTYNMDLVESYLALYPDRFMDLFFYDETYKYYDSPARVRPRCEKFELIEGKIRQYHATALDIEKLKRFSRDEKASHWVKTDLGQGQIFQTSLLVKMLGLVFTKFTLLDPYGMGIEMEAGKPGWNDALNGLPGLFGSSMAEQVELQRLVAFLMTLKDQVADEKITIEIPIEILEHWNQMIVQLEKSLQGSISDFDYWDKSRCILESYREKTRFGISGDMVKTKLTSVHEALKLVYEKLLKGKNKALELGQGLLPTFFTFEWDLDEKEIPCSESGISEYLTLKSCKALPHFLEAPARALKSLKGDEAKCIYDKVKASSLYDSQLKMYKTSVSIEKESHEIGRIRAFTPGWLERESIFLHMEYKYLLGLLKSGQYENFFKTFKDTLIPFQNPVKYGRPITENVSFIASTNNPDPGQHGRGHMARLSGSTAEFIHMWLIMMVGQTPFTLKDNELVFKPQPCLPAWLFDANNEISFKLFGQIDVLYKNVNGKPTFGPDGAQVDTIRLVMNDGQVHNFSRHLEGKFARAVRNGSVKKMYVTLV